MILKILAGFLFLLSVNHALAIDKKTAKSALNIRETVGQVLTAPILYKKKLYYLNTKGHLFQSNLKMTTQKNIFKTKQSTMSSLVIDKGIAYFGDGLHNNKNSFFYAFNLKKKKLLFSKSIKGHFEKTPIIYKNLIIVSAGAGGLIAFNKKTGVKIWNISKFSGKKLHIDATPLLSKGKLYFTSIYKYPAIWSVKADTGVVLWSRYLKIAIKSDLQFYKKYIIALANNASMYSPSNKKGELLVFNTNDGSVFKRHEVRGFNFFSFLVKEGSAWLSSSAGDVIKYDLKKFKITHLDKLPSSISTGTFIYKKNVCVASQKGHLACYNLYNKRVFNKKYKEIFAGYVSNIEGKVFIPTPQGYFSL